MSFTLEDIYSTALILVHDYCSTGTILMRIVKDAINVDVRFIVSTLSVY